MRLHARFLALLFAAPLAASFAAPLAGHAQAAAASETPCLGQVRSAAEAAAKADWILEATVDVVAYMGKDRTPEVTVEDIKVVNDKRPSKVYRIAVLPLDACPHPSALTLAKAAKGQRLRFYGNRHATPQARRILFVEDVKAPLPPVPPVVVFPNRSAQGENPAGDGWHRARSAIGKFSVDLPGPFVDVTRGGGADPGAMLRSTDRRGAVFMALFEPFGPDAQLYRTFDEGFDSNVAERTVYRGQPALQARAVQPSGVVFHSLLVRVPGGTFMLGIETRPENEKAALAGKERFFRSLTLD